MSDGNEQRLPTEPNRSAFAPETLKPMLAAVAIVAFSSVEWIAKVFGCSDVEAAQFKANAQHDFDCMMFAARRAMGGLR